jgi:hypothetical protein
MILLVTWSTRSFILAFSCRSLGQEEGVEGIRFVETSGIGQYRGVRTLLRTGLAYSQMMFNSIKGFVVPFFCGDPSVGINPLEFNLKKLSTFSTMIVPSCKIPLPWVLIARIDLDIFIQDTLLLQRDLSSSYKRTEPSGVECYRLIVLLS